MARLKKTETKISKSTFFARGLLIILACFGSGRLGSQIHLLTGYSPLIWAPAGIALAALVLWGTEYWSWVFLAALLTSLTSHASIVSAVMTAGGSACGPWVGAMLFKKFASPQPTLSKISEVGILAVGTMGLGAFLSSSLGVLGFYLDGRLPDTKVFETWRSWWLGSAMGNLVIAGALIAWTNDIRFRLQRFSKNWWEAALVFASIICVCLLIYTPLATYNHSLIIKPYFLFSLMLWASLRFDLLGATTTSLIIACSAVAGMLGGFSAFANNPPNERLPVLQLFSAAIGVTGLVLAAAMREKMEAVEARNEFLGIASHELKTPITSLQLQLQLTLKRLTVKTDRTEVETQHQTLLIKMDKQIKRLVQIVEQLLDISVIERRTLVLQYEETDLSLLVRNLLERFSNDLANARCDVELKLGSDVHCLCDPFRIEQVLENILSNAIKYAPGKPLQVETSRANGQAQILIRDHGEGIEDSKVPYIFDRFVRASHSPQVKGLGLGLFITRQIVEAHHGAITAESSPGQGTAFRVSIPSG